MPGQRGAAQSPALWASTSSRPTESTSAMSYLVTSASFRAFSHALIVHLVKCTHLGEMHSNLAHVSYTLSISQAASPVNGLAQALTRCERVELVILQLVSISGVLITCLRDFVNLQQNRRKSRQYSHQGHTYTAIILSPAWSMPYDRVVMMGSLMVCRIAKWACTSSHTV